MGEDKLELDYATITRLVSTMETLSQTATTLFTNLDGLQDGLKANWESVESKFLFEGEKYQEFINNIGTIKTDIDEVKVWCNDTMAAFMQTQSANVEEISAAMNGF